MPTAVLDLEFTSLPAIITGLEGYAKARALVRVGGCPVAWVTLPVEDGHILAQVVANAVLQQADGTFWQAYTQARITVPLPRAGVYPSATIAICTRDRPDDLRRCLAALQTLPDDGQEVLVVDSASRTDETQQVAASFQGVRCLRLERPGLNVARNAAILASTKEIVAFIDDDALADPGWLRGLLEAFRHPLTMVVTGITLPVELEADAQEKFEAFNPFSRGFTTRTFSRRNTHPLAAGDAGAGVNMALRRDVIDRVGLFDEALDAGTPTQSSGETEFFSRVLSRQYRIEYTPRALNWHRHRRSTAELRRAIYGYGVGVYAFWTSRMLFGGEWSAPFVALLWFWHDQLPRFLRSLARRPGAPPWPLPWDELRGCLAGPWAYLRSRARLPGKGTPRQGTPGDGTLGEGTTRDSMPGGGSRITRVPRISVIIPTRGASPVLAHTLTCLAGQTLPPETYEVIVASAGTVEDIRRQAPQDLPYSLRVLQVPEKGAAVKRNAGAHAALASLLVFIDDDMAAAPDFLEAHLQAHGDQAVPRVVLGYFRAPESPHAGWLELNVRDWWEDSFYEMGQAGRRFRYVDLFSGNFSLLAAFFHTVGGFNRAYLCHEDYELGLRLIEAGACFEVCYAARCVHQDVTDLRRLMNRKKAEGKADIQLARQYPRLGCDLPFAGQITHLTLFSKTLRGIAHVWPGGADLVVWLLIPLLFLVEKLKLRSLWQWLLGGLLVHAYWQGIFIETRDWKEIRALAGKPLPAPEERIDLACDIGAGGEEFAHRCLNGVQVSWYGIPSGILPAQVGTETLRANHLEAWLQGSGRLPLARAKAVFSALSWNGVTGDGELEPCDKVLEEAPPWDPSLDPLTPCKVAEVELQDGIAGLRTITAGKEPAHVLIRRGGRLLGWLHLEAQRKPYTERSLVFRLVSQLGNVLLLDGNLLDAVIDRPVPEITVIICTRDHPEGLDACLRALSQQMCPPAEIVVVDNAPADDRTAKVAAAWKVHYVREDCPGLDFARNRGVQEAHTAVVAFVDDDARPANDWTVAIGRAFAQHPVAAVTGMVAPAELKTREQCLFEWVYGGMGHGLHQRLVRHDLISPAELLWASGFGVGTNMAFSREILLSLGGFDPALDVGGPAGGGGDVEIFHRLVAAGHSLFYEPAVLVWHQHRKDWKALRRQLFDNGRSFGAYLLTCATNHTVPRGQIATFALLDWIYGWLVWRFFHPGKFPRSLVLAEILGALFSPLAFLQARRRVKAIG
jgi:glycosyltransferase involved in cell wall biosynthesis